MHGRIKLLLFFLTIIILNTPRVFAQEVLLTPPNPDNSQIQKASAGAPFNQGWNYFTVGFDGCTTLTVLNELQANGGSALNVNAVFVKDFFNWQSYTFQSAKQKKLGSSDLLAFNSNQKFFLQIDQKSCTNPDSARQAQINKVREGETAKSNLLDKVSELPVDLWTKLTNILNREGAAPDNTSSNKQSLDNLTIGGKTTVNDLGITGKVTAGLLSLDGLQSTISSLTDIKFELPGGQVLIDKNGNLKTIGTLSIGKIEVNQDDNSRKSAGSVTIKAGESQVQVTTNSLTPRSLIFATPDKPVAVGARVGSSNTIIILLKEQASEDIKVSWWIVN